MTAVRVALAATGGVLALVGAVLLVGQPWTALVSVVGWLGGGVIAHDAVLAPVVVVAGWWAMRRLPPVLRLPMIVTVVVWGTVAAVAVPVLLIGRA